ncbi:DUF4175 family protein [Muriicola sp. Z0-33]|uniref:DUF4175 family protein n=1 Tax=Muriicola sp. Z0-33 TaxID=2816957 RepID=UPI00223766C7|nr:DUF4175 family protein [Muriicola sp. Z0-33]
MLVKGGLLFLALGVIFFFVVLGVEYFLWLNSTGRLLLLLFFIGVEAYLLFRYILIPLFYLFKLKKGISNKQASVLIGRHFPEVGDKLFNLLDLAESKEQSELLVASIEQRSIKLHPIPFVKAIDFKENLKYARYMVIPLLLFGVIWISGNINSFFSSYKRVLNYDTAYEPPAPFEFRLISGDLNVLESAEYVIQVATEGKVRPENVYLMLNDKKYLLQQKNGVFQHQITPPLQSSSFYFEANGVTSRNYELNALRTPGIQNFRLELNYPDYTNKPTEALNSTGNATFPEGTQVSWKINGRHTDRIELVSSDSTQLFLKDEDTFSLSRSIYSDFAYQLATSNENVANYEKLEYRFNVIKDAYPTIKARQVLDSLNPNVAYYSGEASDDYKLKSIRLVCYPESNRENVQVLELGSPNKNFEQFYYTFPSGLELQEGEQYSFYFEVQDNDALRKGKTTKSQVFSLAVLDDNQLKNKQLENQQSIINQLDRSLDSFKEQKETLKEINREQKEKSSLNFNDQRQIKDFLQKQQQQEEMMQKFSKDLKENLQKEERDDELNKLLQERLERQEIQARKNEKLLEELNKVADKIDKEELSRKLEELGKNQQNTERSLEQLVELTKRYYVTEKAAQLSRDLEKEAKKQEILSELKLGEEFSNEEQQKLNENFEEISEELRQLQKDNQDLKKPLRLKIDKEKEEGVKTDQNQALEEINKHQGAEESSESGERQKMGKRAKQKQKSAAQKMQEMSDDLKDSSSSSGGGSSIAEDAEMLRQILDNLITFSFKQEKLYESLEGIDLDVSHFSSSVRQQQELRDLFEHVDDSLFALSLRRAELSEFVNEQITDVYYNIDKSLGSMAENQLYQGVSYQQYVLTASNNLADFLANLLDNMQQSMSQGNGSGSSSQGFQLPDIIKAQGELKDKMGEIGESGKEGKDGGSGEEGKDGKKGEGENGEGGEKGDGKDGGEQGKSGKSGENGKEGKGKQSGEGKEGSGGNSGTSGQTGPSEEELKELYEIYKEQQLLRQQLEQQLTDMINTKDRQLGQKLIQQMQDFENDLLENGITQRTMNKMNSIQHQLLKLENASLKQGQKEERESVTDKSAFQNPITNKPVILRDFRDENEILNRQTLPLHQIFQEKVRNYFRNND